MCSEALSTHPDSGEMVDLAQKLREIQQLLRSTYGRELENGPLAALQAILAATAPAEPSQFRRSDATVLFADLRGFSGFAAHHPARLVLRLLNEYLVRMTEIVVANGGVVDKFLGDALMVQFDAAHARDAPMRAVTCAAQMQRAMDEINAAHRRHGVPATYMGVGIHTGPVMAGVLGSTFHREYTVIGENVNLASRIESVSLRGQVLISDATWRRCRSRVRTGPSLSVHVKGADRPLRVRELRAIPSLRLVVPDREPRSSPRALVELRARFQRVVGKAIHPAVEQATIRDVGYAGVLLESRTALPRWTELQLDFTLGPSLRARNVYARVVRVGRRRRCWLAGLEFTSLDDRLERRLRRYVQLHLQEHDQARAHVHGLPITAE